MAASIPATINDLPDELINEIVSEDCLSAKDLFNLLLTSRRFSSITGQWLYHTFDTIATKAGSRSLTSRRGLWGIVEEFAYTMALHPDRAAQVKKTRLQGVAGIWSGRQYTYTAAEDDPLIEAARKTGIITEGNFFNLGRGDGGLEFLLILFLTPNLTELEIYQPSRYSSLKQIWHAVLKPESANFHGFTQLRHFSVACPVSIVQYGGNGLDLETVTYFLRLPSLRSFTAIWCDLPVSHMMTTVHFFRAEGIRTDCAAGTSRVKCMTFDSCVLPCYALSNPIRACNALQSLTYRWGRGLRYYELHFPDLHNVLLS